VTNTGPLIPASEIQRLFQPFQRLNGTRTQHTDGHGLGLAIVQAIATAHNATITAQPRQHGGLSIEISFPGLAANIPGAPESDPLERAAAPSAATPPALTGLAAARPTR
jgi:signal transduction histidine kinase